MYLKKTKNSMSGRTYLSIVRKYRQSGSEHSKTKTIRSLGYLDLLEKEYDDPIEFFKNIVEKMNKEENEKNTPKIIKIDSNSKLEIGDDKRKYFGYMILSKIYNNLKLEQFFNSRLRDVNTDYNINSIIKLLVYERILNPGSKKKAFENKHKYFDEMNFSLENIYRTLSHVNKHIDKLQLWIHQNITNQYNRNTELVYYDVTNYYFESEKETNLKKKGYSKEHKKTPIIQMGLFMDTLGIPIAYKLFEGNTPDVSTLRPMINNIKIQNDYELGKIIIVADRGIHGGDNIYYNLSAGNGYVLSKSIRGANKSFKDYVLDVSGYRENKDKTFKIKSRLYPREIYVTTKAGAKIKKTVHEKQVVYYSEKFAKRTKAERATTVAKARDLAAKPSKYNKATSYGTAKYINNVVYDRDTGEILTPANQLLFDEAKLKNEEKYDGYYSIVTSEHKKTDDEIIEIYRGLWKIEETFKITKSDLETRPIYLSREDRIKSHFLICYISLVILRILQHRIDNKYSVSKIIESIKSSQCSNTSENQYTFDYYDEILDSFGTELGLTLNNQFLTRKEIKNILGNTKK